MAIQRWRAEPLFLTVVAANDEWGSDELLDFLIACPKDGIVARHCRVDQMHTRRHPRPLVRGHVERSPDGMRRPAWTIEFGVPELTEPSELRRDLTAIFKENGWVVPSRDFIAGVPSAIDGHCGGTYTLKEPLKLAER